MNETRKPTNYLSIAMVLVGLLLTAVAIWKVCLPGRDVGYGMSSPCRVGDSQSQILTEKLDSRFVDMVKWARAGVRGGIPSKIPAIITVLPGENIQLAIDNAAAVGGGMVQLGNGTYPITEAITLRSNVVLSGAGPELTILENRMRTKWTDERNIVGIRLIEVVNAGVQNLTILSPYVRDLPPKTYMGQFNDNMDGIDDLHVGHIVMHKAFDCWLDNCRILYSGTAPIIIDACAHITLRNNIVDTSFNKGGNGSGYYLLTASSYVLCFNETVRNIRHFVIQNGSTYNVVLGCRFEVDINFHGEDDGHNLIEDCIVALPSKHQWPPISYWRRPPGPDNILYRITASKGKTQMMEKGVPCDPLAVYTVKDGSPRARLYDVAGPVPQTFYPMSGQR